MVATGGVMCSVVITVGDVPRRGVGNMQYDEYLVGMLYGMIWVSDVQ